MSTQIIDLRKIYTPTTQQNKAHISPARYRLYGGAVGGGKGQPYSAIIITPFGLRTMGDIKIGSIISNPNGEPQHVVRITELGEREICRISFDDGTQVDTTLDHLWLIHRTQASHRSKKASYAQQEFHGTVWTAKQIHDYINNPKYNSKYKLCVPLTKPVNFTKSCKFKQRTINPWFLGLLLGDGSIGGRGELSFSTADQEIVDRVKELGYTIRDGGNYSYGLKKDEIKNQLEKLGLLGTKSHDKFIPKYYKLAPTDERWQLIHGLMDSDGYVDKRGHLNYCTVSKQLANDVAFVCRSLGAKVTITTKQPHYKTKEGKRIECRLAYELYIQSRNNADFVWLKRKKQRAIDKPYNGGKGEPMKRIVKTEMVESQQSRCIAVENANSLYLTNGFTVTHNSVWLTEEGLQLSLDFPGNVGYMMRWENRTFKQTTLQTMREFIPDELILQHKLGDQQFLLTNGSVIMYGGLKPSGSQNPIDRIKSLNLGWFGVDEATEIPEDFYLMLCSRLRRDIPDIQYKALLASNPEEGWVYDKFIRQQLEDHEFIPALPSDNPHLPDDYEDKLRAIFPESWIKRYLEGEWGMSQDGLYVYPYAWVKAAAERILEGTSPCVCGLDIGAGIDKTVLATRKGFKFEINHRSLFTDTMVTVAAVAPILDQLQPDKIRVDAVGVGKGPHDRLKELGYPVEEYKGGMNANDPERFADRRSEDYWTLREMMEIGNADIPNDLDVHSQMYSIMYEDNTKVIKVVSKKKMRAQGKKSPDDLDALTMTLGDQETDDIEGAVLTTC